jgi:hypothetical protein
LLKPLGNTPTHISVADAAAARMSFFNLRDRNPRHFCLLRPTRKVAVENYFRTEPENVNLTWDFWREFFSVTETWKSIHAGFARGVLDLHCGRNNYEAKRGCYLIMLGVKASARGDYFCTTLSSTAELVKVFSPPEVWSPAKESEGNLFTRKGVHDLRKKSLTSFRLFGAHRKSFGTRRENKLWLGFRAAEVFCEVVCRRDPQQESLLWRIHICDLRHTQKSCSAANEIKTFQSTT